MQLVSPPQPGRKLLLAALLCAVSCFVAFSCQRARQSEHRLPSTALPSADGGSGKLDTVWVSLRWGQTLDGLLSARGLEPDRRNQLVRAFDEVQSVKTLLAGSQLGLLLGPSKEIEGLLYRPQSWRSVGVRRQGDRWVPFTEEAPTITEVRRLSGTVQTTLYDAFLSRGADPELVMLFSDIFQWDIDFFVDPQPGDQFRVIYEVKCAVTEAGNVPLQTERILAAQYVLGRKVYSAIYFEGSPGKSGYYDEQGRSFQKSFLKSPLNYRRITSRFTGARFHPIFKRIQPHYAVDFAAPEGTPVVATGAGVVVDAGWSNGLGNYVRIRHANSRYETLYGHLSAFAPGIRKGVHVAQNEVIGYVGQTGIATGPHLHYAFYENGRPINPLRLQRVTGEPLPQTAMADFRAVRDRFLAELATLQVRPPLLYSSSGWPFPPLPNALSVPRP
jgi:murein DD-endopeptidase MepM/ murein hydrolase activator NlpD